MQEKPSAVSGRAPSCVSLQAGRVRPRELMRRKLIRKMLARRERSETIAGQTARTFLA